MGAVEVVAREEIFSGGAGRVTWELVGVAQTRATCQSITPEWAARWQFRQ